MIIFFMIKLFSTFCQLFFSTFVPLLENTLNERSYRDLWHLRHWLQYWRLRTWVYLEYQVMALLSALSRVGNWTTYIERIVQSSSKCSFWDFQKKVIEVLCFLLHRWPSTFQAAKLQVGKVVKLRKKVRREFPKRNLWIQESRSWIR